jgi:DNA invertase Pin-like site-specific DNA recombinase
VASVPTGCSSLSPVREERPKAGPYSRRKAVLAQAKTNTLKSDPLAPSQDLIRGYTRQRITVRMSARVAELYAGGASTRDVAAQTGVSRTTVLRILKDLGIGMRPRGGHG